MRLNPAYNLRLWRDIWCPTFSSRRCCSRLLIFGLLYAYPFLDKFTSWDNRPHNVLKLPLSTAVQHRPGMYSSQLSAPAVCRGRGRCHRCGDVELGSDDPENPSAARHNSAPSDRSNRLLALQAGGGGELWPGVISQARRRLRLTLCQPLFAQNPQRFAKCGDDHHSLLRVPKHRVPSASCQAKSPATRLANRRGRCTAQLIAAASKSNPPSPSGAIRRSLFFFMTLRKRNRSSSAQAALANTEH